MADAAGDRREGRGRLSTIDRLPDSAEPDIAWALQALRDRSMPANAILDEFNARLADRGIAKVSSSAFNRYSIRKARQFRRLDELRDITNDLVASLGTSDADDVTIATAEILKACVYERVERASEDDEGLKGKEIKELSNALKDIVAAQKGSAAYRQQLEQRMNTQLEKAAEKVGEAEQVMREAGLSADQVAQIRRDVLGLRVG
jgi:hypothetical protein